MTIVVQYECFGRFELLQVISREEVELALVSDLRKLSAIPERYPATTARIEAEDQRHLVIGKEMNDQTNEITVATNATILTIAGSDPSGGAGMQADLKTFQQLGCYGMSVVTMLTVQNTQGVQRVEMMPVDLVQQQFDSVVSDIPPRIVKTGALGTSEMVRAVAEKLSEASVPVVVDPVLISKHGHRLADDGTIDTYVAELMPLANVFTPNRFEAEAIVGRKLETPQDFANATAKLQSLGPQVVVLKAGEVDGQQHHMIATGDSDVRGLAMESLQERSTHGAGCVFSAAIAGRLALDMQDKIDVELIDDAIRFACSAVHYAIEFEPELGSGVGPVETRVIRP